MAPETSAAIAVESLAKRYGDVQAVAGITFEVGGGEVFGFLGPNGAGKTTTINMLTGLARPDSGRISYHGQECTADVKRAQHLMGVVPDESNLWPELTGHDNLVFCATLYGMTRRDREERARELLAAVGLKDAAGRLFAGYSKGMKRKLAIAAGIMHRPGILFLDEPTTGIDVASARQIRQMLVELGAAGTTIFLTTHYIEEAERLCDRIGFIVDGRLVCVDTLENLTRELEGRHVVHLTLGSDAGRFIEPLRARFPNVAFEAVGGCVVRARTAAALPLAPLIRFFEEQGVDVMEARVMRPSLEDVFVRVTGVAAERIRKEKEQGGGKGGGA